MLPLGAVLYDLISRTTGRITVTRRVLELQLNARVSNMPNLYRALIVAAVLLATPNIAKAEISGASQATAAVGMQSTAIDGFRSAHFGMNEVDIRRAIQRDFAL